MGRLLEKLGIAMVRELKPILGDGFHFDGVPIAWGNHHIEYLHLVNEMLVSGNEVKLKLGEGLRGRLSGSPTFPLWPL